ncbi:5-formyltetrahydrofolate cyclo-ligase [Paenibacillus physcomitrellae]|uniref:5-formyltetrahydrofolate cyclo-ligase n=1 Tax=Paenibacillus physcomitrellae TaxID=1619311 RepID=A0ABQ1FTD7_9BACL|nr:5-formyltetrahydrofolate cyclo-ligase [Paenibacillus physcomitrellae]GGA27671.1 5-formyltetrahydrofolate cyclo-ligase [Paenibacillus physcomitrellae]
MDLKEKKRLLRQEAAAKRASLGETERRMLSESACRLAEDEVLAPLRRSRPGQKLTLFSYLSFKDELSTRSLVDSCLGKGDTVLVPRITKGGMLAVHRFEDWSSLKPGVWGISEPAADSPVWPEERYGEIDVVIVPGLVYDLHGGRIGYGGGYYDRFTQRLKQTAGGGAGRTLFASLLFEEQLAQQVPAQAHDLRLDVLITPANVFYINKDDV